MVKNLSNPLNARKVAKILADDTAKAGFNVQERDISVFLSDHRISDLQTALKQLQSEEIIPQDYEVSEDCQQTLIEENFISAGDTLSNQSGVTSTEDLSFLQEENINSIEFKTQIDSLKNKLIKSWSGGISIDGNELENFDRKFAKPMEYFKKQYTDDYGEISDLQAFAVVYATDHLSLGDNSKTEVYDLMFGRFDRHKETLEKKYGFKYSWPKISGTSFIEMGKKFSIGPELSEFAKKFRSISGLDTYPDSVIQVFFYNLISGPFIEEMIDKKLLFRWSDDTTVIAEPIRWLFPPSEYNIDSELKELLTQSVITHTLLQKIEGKPPSLMEIMDEINDLERNTRPGYLAKKIEAALTRKSVALQFGTTLANFFENFKKNPSKVTPFLDTTYRYFSKTEEVTTLFTTIEHNIKTALKNSTGIIKEYLRNISDDDLTNTIRSNLDQSLNYVILTQFSDNSELIGDQGINLEKLDYKMREMEVPQLKELFGHLFDQLFVLTNKFARSLEPQKIEPKSNKGGLTELTQDFTSTISYHGSKNYQNKSIIEKLVETGIDEEMAELICYTGSYITYQIASKEGGKGEKMLSSFVENYADKTLDIGNIELNNNQLLKTQESFRDFITQDLIQAQALVAIASKIKTDAYNAWTPLKSGRAKATLFFNEMIMPNLLFWQRLPREFIMQLVENNLLPKSMIKELVIKSHRYTLIEAYSLLTMGTSENINSFGEAKTYINSIFSNEENLQEAFKLNSRSGEAEIALEAILLWSNLQEVTV